MSPKNPSTDDDSRRLISPKELALRLEAKDAFELLDVRSAPEHQVLSIPGARLATRELVDELLTKWPKDRDIVLYDHFGRSALDAARVLEGRGFTRVRALRGGIDAWSQEIDPLTPRYA